VCGLRQRTEDVAGAADGVEHAVRVLGEVEGANGAVQPIVNDRGLLRLPRANLVWVDDDAVREDVAQPRLARRKDVAVHLRDPRRRAVAHVRVARHNVVVGAARLSVVVEHLPEHLRVEPHHGHMVEPARRDLLDVVDVEEVVPPARGVPLAVRPGGRVVVHIRPRDVGLLLGEELVLQAVTQARVEVTDVLRDDDARFDAHLDRVHRQAQQHVRVDVQHVVHVLGLLRLVHPVHDRARLVVRGRHV
jgi:hypothetical protein